MGRHLRNLKPTDALLGPQSCPTARLLLLASHVAVRFYPDFVAELTDGRILVVEYKGEHIADSADTREKRNLGALWEEKSGGKGLFLMAEKRAGAGRDLSRQLADKIRRES